MEKMKMESVDMVEENIEKLAKIFPNCITEIGGGDGKIKKGINFEILKQDLSDEIVDGDEAFDFTWVGKNASIAEANRPIRKTLRPCVEKSVNWDTTENLYIEGDNLEALKLLQENYLGMVKIIYIDPPYNTGNDFIYKDNFSTSKEEYSDAIGEINEEGNRLFRNTDSNGRFHSDWCSMIYSRILLAKNLLSEDGVIFISLNDIEYENMKKICNEIFGENNFVANFIWQSTPGSNTGLDIKTVTENILCYCKNNSNCFSFGQAVDDEEKYVNKDEYYEKRGGYILNKLDRRMTGTHYSDALNYAITMPDGTELFPGSTENKQAHWNWRWSATKVKWGIENGFIVFRYINNSWSVYFKQYYKVDNNDKSIIRSVPYQNLLNVEGANSARGTQEIMNILGFKAFDYPKPLNLLQYILKIFDDDNAIIMDFFSGSATTAHATMELNAEDGGHRKYIMVQLAELCDENSEAYKVGCKTICDIGEERIRRAAKKIHEEHPDAQFDDGFRVFKVDDSNMNDVYYSAGDYTQGMLKMMESNIKEDRSDLDLFFGCILDWGLKLSLPYTEKEIDGSRILIYNDGDLIACFDKNISENVVKEIANMKPLRAVFRDESFINSSSKINVAEIFKMLSSDTTVKVI